MFNPLTRVRVCVRVCVCSRLVCVVCTAVCLCPLCVCVQVREYLASGWGTVGVQEDVAALKAQSDADVSAAVHGLLPISLEGTPEVYRCGGVFPWECVCMVV